MTRHLVVAVDGPAASGKGTLAKRIAAHFGLPHLDTGLIYRALAFEMQSRGLDPDDAQAATATARGLDPSVLDNPALRTRAIGDLASRVAVHREARAALVEFQRRFAAQPGGAVLDGRDIGTVICPDAAVKLFVTASPEVRAERRFRELTGRGEAVLQDAILADIRQRDARDSGRADAPLRQAEDAHLIDTSAMAIDDVVARAIAIITAQSQALAVP
jgi:CMP/dCMP kinase